MMMRDRLSPTLAGMTGVALGLVIGPLLRRLRRVLRPPQGTHVVRGGESVLVSRRELIDVVAACLVKSGATREHAEVVAECLVFADARGIPSHGVNRADFYCAELEAGLIDGKAVGTTERESGCCAVVDGRNALGAVVSQHAMELAISKARQHGVGWVTCRGSNHFGAAGFWAQRALDAGLIGFSFTNTAPFMVPTGGRTRAVGTNPICCFAPAGDDSFQLDMATTAVPIGKVEVLSRLGKQLPLGWGVDRHGMPCVEPEEVVSRGGLAPLGGSLETAGYKGYGLGMLVEVLTSVLSGASVGPDVPPWTTAREDPLGFGHCFIVIDPERFTPGFDARLGAYLSRMRGLDGDVITPGDPERQRERAAAASGVSLHENIATSVAALASRLGVELPKALRALDIANARASTIIKGKA